MCGTYRDDFMTSAPATRSLAGRHVSARSIRDGREDLGAAGVFSNGVVLDDRLGDPDGVLGMEDDAG